MNHPLYYLRDYKVILGSASPRRKELLSTIWPNFDVRSINADESFPTHLKAHQIPEYLAHIKAEQIRHNLKDNEILITADTIVWSNDMPLNKPGNFEEAAAMLQQLSNSQHQVFTGVQLCYQTSKSLQFVCETTVWFKPLTDQEINWYIHQYKPFDKAGGYGIQEWIGYIGISHILGDYYNVMGLPVSKLYGALKELENELKHNKTVKGA